MDDLGGWLKFPPIFGNIHISTQMRGSLYMWELHETYYVTPSCALGWKQLKTPRKRSQPYLEDHPMTCKWLITIVSKSPIPGVMPLENGLFMAYKWGLLSSHLIKSWWVKRDIFLVGIRTKTNPSVYILMHISFICIFLHRRFNHILVDIIIQQRFQFH